MTTSKKRYALHCKDCLELTKQMDNSSVDAILLLTGDSRQTLETLPDKSVHTCVTSPPYWGLRDYSESAQLGLEDTPQAFVDNLVDVFGKVKRVLKDDGTVWLNLGDSYCGKDLVGIPWRVAFALQKDGWYLRQDIIWHKPNSMPESVKDRCTKAHEYIFLLSKNKKYYYDHEAVKQDAVSGGGNKRIGGNKYGNSDDPKYRTKSGNPYVYTGKKNRRSVWTVTTKPFKGAHFATFPPDLIEPCVLAGCPEGGTVLDPFGGSGTTAVVAARNNRKAILCEINPEYIAMAEQRIANETQQQELGLPVVAEGYESQRYRK